jgi:YihY family inner membrane protein
MAEPRHPVPPGPGNYRTAGWKPAVNHAGGGSSDAGAPPAGSEGKSNAITRVVARLDAYQRQHPWLAFPTGVMKKFGDDQSGYLAALVAYYAFFSLFPLLLVFVTVLGFVLGGNPALRGKIVNTVAVQIPVIGGQIKDTAHPIHGNGLALAVGIAGTLLAGLGVIQALQHGMDEIWDVPRVDRPNFLWSRLRAILLLAVLGVGSLASTLLSGIAASGGSFGGALKLGGIAASLALNFALFLVSFRVLTSAKIRWSDVVPGAVVAALAWAALQSAGTYYVGHQLRHASATYGFFAVVIGLLSWIYLGAQVTFLAAEVNVVKARRLWPRGLQPPLTEADRQALAEQAKQQEIRPEQRIRVEFDPASAAGTGAVT